MQRSHSLGRRAVANPHHGSPTGTGTRAPNPEQRKPIPTGHPLHSPTVDSQNRTHDQGGSGNPRPTLRNARARQRNRMSVAETGGCSGNHGIGSQPISSAVSRSHICTARTFRPFGEAQRLLPLREMSVATISPGRAGRTRSRRTPLTDDGAGFRRPAPDAVTAAVGAAPQRTCTRPRPAAAKARDESTFSQAEQLSNDSDRRARRICPYHNCSVETADAANTATTLTSTAAATAATIATGRRRSHSAVKMATAAPAQAAGDELLDIGDAILRQITDPSTVRALEFVGVTQFDLLAQRGQGKVRIGSSQCHCYAQPLVGETRRHPHIGHNQIRTVLGDSRFQFRGMDSCVPENRGQGPNETVSDRDRRTVLCHPWVQPRLLLSARPGLSCG